MSSSQKFSFIPSSSKIFYSFLLCFILFCQNANLYYSFAEGNIKILEAYAIKDSTCGTSHIVNQFLLGDSYKNDVDACVDAIYAVDCIKWKETDPTPRECLGVNTKNK